MKLTIKYFGLLAEITKCVEESIEFSGGSVNDLRKELTEKHSGLLQVNYQVAQDLEIVSDETEIRSNEIVLLPPFAGG
jgi:molybdopterin converting factor small subunit